MYATFQGSESHQIGGFAGTRVPYDISRGAALAQAVSLLAAREDSTTGFIRSSRWGVGARMAQKGGNGSDLDRTRTFWCFPGAKMPRWPSWFSHLGLTNQDQGFPLLPLRSSPW